jgi:hypothetical protein
MQRFLIVTAAAAGVLVLAADNAAAQWGAQAYRNPWTGGTAWRGGAHNPWTGATTVQRGGYNPWTGRSVQSRSYVNPWTGTRGRSVSVHNPWTGRSAHVGGVRRW